MDAIILCGGLGSRLASAWDGPKCLAPSNGKPFLYHLLDQLESAGFRRTVLCIGYKGNEVKNAVGYRRYGGMKITYSQEDRPLGTGGALAQSASKVKGLVLAMNGDSYVHCNLRRLTDFHAENSFDVGMLAVHTPNRYDKHVVDCDANGKVERYFKGADKREGWVSAGVYVLNPSMIPSAKFIMPLSLEEVVMPELVLAGKVAVLGIRAPFIDIGTPESYKQAESFFNNLSPTACAAARER